MLIQLDEFQSKSSKPFQEVTKRLFPTCNVKMGHFHLKWQSLSTKN